MAITAPPAATLRDQDAADLQMLLAGLKWRDGADLTGPDEFSPLSGSRWHIVLERFLSKATGAEKTREAAELEYLLKLLERDGTRMPVTERRWADILRRFIRADYDAPKGRRKQDVRDRLLLDGGGDGVAAVGHRLEDFGGESQGVKAR